jgi:hypothetical protein
MGREILRLPLGIWFVWGALGFAAFTFVDKLVRLRDLASLSRVLLVESIATWLLLFAFLIALARRRPIAWMLGGMAMLLLFFHALFHQDLIGMAVALAGFAALIPQRRWLQ